jgi:hypothetical protein
MIETPADYRSFIFCKANKTPVCSLCSGLASLSSAFSLESGVLFFSHCELAKQSHYLMALPSAGLSVTIFFRIISLRKLWAILKKDFASIPNAIIYKNRNFFYLCQNNNATTNEITFYAIYEYK